MAFHDVVKVNPLARRLVAVRRAGKVAIVSMLFAVFLLQAGGSKSLLAQGGGAAMLLTVADASTPATMDYVPVSYTHLTMPTS